MNQTQRKENNVNRNLTAIALVLIVALTFGCAKKVPSIEGKWAIDLEPMIQQARDLNASSRDIEAIKENFRNGRLEIDTKRITVTIEGINDREIREYVVSSNEGACSLLLIQSSAKPHKYCLSDNRLKVNDPSTPLIAVYRRL